MLAEGRACVFFVFLGLGACVFIHKSMNVSTIKIKIYGVIIFLSKRNVQSCLLGSIHALLGTQII